jgi:hypothetical protein
MGRKTREEKDYVFQPETWDNRIRFGTSLGVNLKYAMSLTDDVHGIGILLAYFLLQKKGFSSEYLFFCF